MALCLLRFHDAPSAFRRQVISTLADEQRHAQAYLSRMNSCGVTLGERPVNGTFWNHLKDMDSVENYCSGMALTLEQANLDFSLHFEKRFRQAGDTTTADLLKEVYEDEIFHVRVGVQHMNSQLKEDDHLWDLWTQHLTPPLSPSRAKAFELDVEGRRKAGLDEDFISRLDRYERSKGRPPRVFVFNGLAEQDALGGQSSKERLAMNQDFQTVLHTIAHNDDLILVDSPPSTHFLDHLKTAGFSRPEWRLKEEKQLHLGHQKIASLHPWAWSQSMWKDFKPWWAKQTQLQPNDWSPASLAKKGDEHLKKSGLSFLPTSKHHQPVHHFQNPEDLTRYLENHSGPHLLKPSLSSSGHGHLQLDTEETINPTVLEKFLCRHQGCVVEPLHKRVADFSHPAHFDGQQIDWRGTTRMLVDSKGRYQGTWQGGLMDGLPEEARRTLHDSHGQPIWKSLHKNWDAPLKSTFLELGYRGPFSIDAYLHIDTENKEMHYRGCCELNLRTTFGHVSLGLEKNLRKGSRGMMTFIPSSDWVTLPSLTELQNIQKGKPGCWTGGIFPVNDIWAAEKVSVLWLVGDNIQELQSLLKSVRVTQSSHIHERFDLIQFCE